MQLVTGGSGYFGSYLVKYLTARQIPVRVLDLYDAADRSPDVEFVQGDIRSLQIIKTALEGVDVVHHNVAMVPLSKDKEAFWSVNYEGTNNLLQQCREIGVKKIIHMSSSAVYGIPQHNPVDETQIPYPGESYGMSKLAAEDLCRQYVEMGLDITIIRPRTIMGHGRLGIMQILFDWIYRGRPVPVFDRGENKYQFLHAEDLADACLRAAQRPGSSLYHIGAEHFGSMRDTLQELIIYACSNSKLVSLPLRPAEAMMNLTSVLGVSPLGAYHAMMYGRSMYFDLSKAKLELGWQPRFSNAEMFAQSYDWYVANRLSLKDASGASQHRRPVDKGILSLVNWCLQVLPGI